MGKTVTLEDYNTKCDNSVSDKQETKKGRGEKKVKYVDVFFIMISYHLKHF